MGHEAEFSERAANRNATREVFVGVDENVTMPIYELLTPTLPDAGFEQRRRIAWRPAAWRP